MYISISTQFGKKITYLLTDTDRQTWKYGDLYLFPFQRAEHNMNHLPLALTLHHCLKDTENQLFLHNFTICSEI